MIDKNNTIVKMPICEMINNMSEMFSKDFSRLVRFDLMEAKENMQATISVIAIIEASSSIKLF